VSNGSRLRADDVQAAIARCLVDPDYMNGKVGGDNGAPPLPSLLLEDLRLFRGFITKIKHTQLRRIAPLTLRLLALYKLDIAFFSRIAAGFQKARSAAPVTATTLFRRFERELTDHLLYVPADVREHVGAMLLHERRIWDAGRAMAYPDPALHPRLRPGVAVERFALNVLELATAMRTRPHTEPRVTAGDHFLLYQPAAGAIRVEDIDALSGWVLSHLDGSTSADALGQILTALVGANAHSAVGDVITDAVARSLLDEPSVLAKA
jgi:hypothetical protein